MKNIIEILSELGITVPEDKHAALNKGVAENYKTIAEHEKKVTRLTEDLNAEKEAHKTTMESLKGFDGLGNAADVKKQLEEANQKIKEAQEAAQKQLAERDFNDALSKALDGIKFTSAAARKAIEADVRANCSKVKDGTIIGFTDVIDAARKADASAFANEQQEHLEQNRARFTQPNNGGGNPTGTLTREDIMKIPDRAERRAAMAKNQHLFTKKENNKWQMQT